jgi:hypothetical protein
VFQGFESERQLDMSSCSLGSRFSSFCNCENGYEYGSDINMSMNMIGYDYVANAVGLEMLSDSGVDGH